MKLSNRMIKFGGLLALAIITFPALSGQAHAYTCKKKLVHGSAQHQSKVVAEQQAQQSWTSLVRQRMGLPWSVASISKNQKTVCKRTNTNKVQCVFWGRPCKYVVQ